MLLALLIGIPLFATMLSAITPRALERFLGWVGLVAAACEIGVVVAMVRTVLEKGSYQASSYFVFGSLEALLLLTISVVGFFTVWYSIGYLHREVEKNIIGFRRVRQYFALVHIFLAAMFFAIGMTNPLAMWIAIEGTTLATAFLISFYHKQTAIEAAWKYLILNSVGLLLGLLGVLFFLSTGAADHAGLLTWHDLFKNAPSANPFVTKLAFILVFIGYGTKVGFVPMHTWRPDAYSKAPTPVVALFSGALLNVAFFVILRFKIVTDAVVPGFSSSILLFFGCASILVPAFFILVQANYKRLLAYSSIEHAGIMALGFSFGGAGVFAALLHMMYHSLAKSSLFFLSGNIFLKYSSTKIKKVTGMLRVLPVTTILFVIAILAITGIPPLGMFLTEFSIIAAGLRIHPVVMTVVIASIILIFIGFFMIVSRMVFGDPPESVSVVTEPNRSLLAPIVVVLALLIVLSVWIPSPLHTLISQAAVSFR